MKFKKIRSSISSSVSWPHRWADSSLAPTTSKVYFTVHLRLQDCNTWLGIRAALTGSREQRGFFFMMVRGLMRAEGPFHNTVQGCCRYFGPREVCGGGGVKGELTQFMIKNNEDSSVSLSVCAGKSIWGDTINHREQASIFY